MLYISLDSISNTELSQRCAHGLVRSRQEIYFVQLQGRSWFGLACCVATNAAANWLNDSLQISRGFTLTDETHPGTVVSALPAFSPSCHTNPSLIHLWR